MSLSMDDHSKSPKQLNFTQIKATLFPSFDVALSGIALALLEISNEIGGVIDLGTIWILCWEASRLLEWCEVEVEVEDFRENKDLNKFDIEP
ncbi:hypothetical protein FNV43_RR21663 [Rhamnella rubrinervis]|uniref:Uncharacterized protein n=1 Tax=Rhamnella rubrinervis TaxID=2594499 RepID=A0A8K0GRU2_9ROSA|nr:hypothetical protein FNV43_RR21663 [Rhamnella rubrinervis]